MKPRLDQLDSLERYNAASEVAAAMIIDAYSTSFGAATRLLGPRHRAHVRNIYALVRVADELVDGATSQAGFNSEQQHASLDQLEAETEQAIETGYSSNPVVQAFCSTARSSGITADLTRPFFTSMRIDLPARASHESAVAPDENGPRTFDDAAHATYVYGSAEVVGLMCLKVFIRDETLTNDQLMTLEHGARRLGAAFQNVNFLRDLADDTGRLGRSYLSAENLIDEAAKARWVTQIRAELQDAIDTLPLLPKDARVAVDCALRFFAKLTDKIAKVSASELYERRIRVSGPEKALIVALAKLDLRKGRVS